MRRTVVTSGRPRMKNALRGAGNALLLLACAWACGGKSGRDPGPSLAVGGSSGAGAGGDEGSGRAGASAGTSASGAAPAGGFSGSGGGSGGSEPVSGMTGSGAGAGTGGGITAGAGGASGAAGKDGGMAGASGEAGSSGFPECVLDEDCEIASDCCSCQAVPKGASFPACRLDCGGSNGCELDGLSTVPRCTLGRCTLATDCGGEATLCDSPPPTCPAGQTPSRTEDGCWGPCVAATECSLVEDCGACGDAHCVEFPNVGGTTIRCIARQQECEVGNLCECLQPCGDFGCGEQDGEVGCFCPAC
jgi:hypothetical protein